MLADIYAALAYTIETYDDLVANHNLPLQKDLVEALRKGMAADIKNKGLKLKVGEEEHSTSVKHQNKQEKKAYVASPTTLKYLKSEVIQGSTEIQHLKSPKATDRHHLEKNCKTKLIGRDKL